jgi:molybdenum cofactor cytidylyltransferase
VSADPSSRDQPHVPKLVGLVLAAGSATRFAGLKQLADLNGRPLVQHVIDNAIAANLDEVVVVLGHEAAHVKAALDLPAAARTVTNPEHADGQSTTLRTGLRALGGDVEAAVVLLADQPTIPAATIRAIVDAYKSSEAPVARARYGDTPGHPVILGRAIWETIIQVTGDRGARDVLASHPDWVVDVDLPGPPPPDINTISDLTALRDDP